MYDIIIIDPKKAQRTKKRETRTCKSSNQIFSVPSGNKKISKIDGYIIIEEILSISKPLDALKFVYKNRFIIFALYKDYFENNTDYKIVRDVFMFVYFVSFLVFFIMYCFKKLKKTRELKNDSLPITWTSIDTIIKEEREKTNKKVDDLNDLFMRVVDEKFEANRRAKDSKQVGHAKSKPSEKPAQEDISKIINPKESEPAYQPLNYPEQNDTDKLFGTVTLEKMKNNPSGINLNIKKDFAKKVGIKVGNSKEDLINQKIIDYLMMDRV